MSNEIWAISLVDGKGREVFRYLALRAKSVRAEDAKVELTRTGNAPALERSSFVADGIEAALKKAEDFLESLEISMGCEFKLTFSPGKESLCLAPCLQWAGELIVYPTLLTASLESKSREEPVANSPFGTRTGSDGSTMCQLPLSVTP